MASSWVAKLIKTYVNYAKKLIPKYRKPWIILLQNKYLTQEDTMNGETIKTLAEYITKLKEENAEYFREYERNQFDTNGVEQDYVESSWSSDEHSGS